MWLARESDDTLIMFNSKPHKDYYDGVRWGTNSDEEDWIILDSGLFPEVTVDNSPIEADIIIKKKEGNEEQARDNDADKRDE